MCGIRTHPAVLKIAHSTTKMILRGGRMIFHLSIVQVNFIFCSLNFSLLVFHFLYGTSML